MRRRNGISRRETRLEAISVHDEIGPALALEVKLEKKKWIEKILQKKRDRELGETGEQATEEAACRRGCWAFHAWMELPWWRVFECAEKVQFRSTGSGVWNLATGIPCGDVKQVAGNSEVKLRDGYVDLEDFIVEAIIESHRPDNKIAKGGDNKRGSVVS